MGFFNSRSKKISALEAELARAQKINEEQHKEYLERLEVLQFRTPEEIDSQSFRELQRISKKLKDEMRLSSLTAQEKSNLETVLALTRKELEIAQNDYKKALHRLGDAIQERNSFAAKLESHEKDLRNFLSSNITSIPWLAGVMADYLTYDLELRAKYLDWGRDQKRLKKVEDIRFLRKQVRSTIEESKIATYQLEYLRKLYPAIDDILESDYRSLCYSNSNLKNIPDDLSVEDTDVDPSRIYLTDEEWAQLLPAERDQLALDRYIASKSKSKWQIGRDYELSVAYAYTKKGFFVDTYGSHKGLEDLGRDLIATNAQRTLIIQCKYWSQQKTIHEKHLFQLYGTVALYRAEHPDYSLPVIGVFVTNISLSDVALKAAEALHITVVQNYPMFNFPRIKCNIGKDKSRIYHLPMDDQYDATKIRDPDEFYAFTVQEAVDAGFVRAKKWFGSDNF